MEDMLLAEGTWLASGGTLSAELSRPLCLCCCEEAPKGAACRAAAFRCPFGGPFAKDLKFGRTGSAASVLLVPGMSWPPDGTRACAGSASQALPAAEVLGRLGVCQPLGRLVGPSEASWPLLSAAGFGGAAAVAWAEPRGLSISWEVSVRLWLALHNQDPVSCHSCDLNIVGHAGGHGNGLCVTGPCPVLHHWPSDLAADSSKGH